MYFLNNYIVGMELHSYFRLRCTQEDHLIVFLLSVVALLGFKDFCFVTVLFHVFLCFRLVLVLLT
jgi:hypothetical protein